MKLNKTAAASAVGLALAGATLSANASLGTSSVLTFSSASGSYFRMFTDPANGVFVQVPIGNFATTAGGGIHIGSTEAAGGSHPGTTPGGESPVIDAPWAFFSNIGMHQVLNNPISVVSHSGTAATLDFTGWNVNWSGITSIPMGGDPTNFGTAGNTGVATMTCSASSCSLTSTYTLDYQATVPLGDASGFGGVPYELHLVGHVAANADPVVPVPAAAWLFGSGLAGLVAVARRRKAKV
jgi:hypothetical protein